ncbi:RelB/DinJ family addiction module antitoxin [Eggerthellaceae bacterium zg-887]|uniref:type II toxin-antitoxin system RelB/DinJ family antitoxin n=1 Tax=Xiamenia xianingshaonis TaxID=2682776 RepID=UPI00140C16D0|nr:type II toxin-antitoxin system RelB/DinJ family antitoxin [Xiamenia xianingshaonis]NHM15914.1 RelB/DinJ family addiction module antitoxin [Xiamenia xianingshaonis]
MVTARMSSGKKEAGNRVLESLGTNASQAINGFYDYVIEHKQLPYQERPKRRAFTSKEIEEAKAFVDDIGKRRTEGRFAHMTIKEARRERTGVQADANAGDAR